MNWKQLYQQLKNALTFVDSMIDKEDVLYQTAHSFLGQDASPSDVAPDEYACAESVSRVLQHAFPGIHFPLLTGTYDLLHHLQNTPAFVEVQTPQYGCVIVSATGTGNGTIANGHTGIVGKNEGPDGTYWIMSNDSRNGIWSVNYTLGTWKAYYSLRGGMVAHYFLPR